MSSSRKFLKIISLVTLLSGVSYIIAAVGFIALGVLGGADVIAVENLPVAMTAQTAGIVLAVLAGGNAVINLMLGLLGLRGANVPSKIGPVRTLALLSLLMCALNLVFCLFQGFGADIAHTFGVVLGLVCSIVTFVLANNVKKEYEAWH